MLVLAVDTARQEGSVALWRAGAVAEVASLGSGPGFGEVLFGAVEALLARHGLALADFDGFAAATGPGSFTGIRVGLSAVKAFAEVHQRPLVGVSSLRALAAAAGAEAGLRAPLLDARRGELFAAVYDGRGAAVLPETVGAWESLAPQLRPHRPLLVVNERQLLALGGPAEAGRDWPRRMRSAAQAGAVAALAARDLAAGRGQAPEAVGANYIRRPSAVPPAWGPAARRR